MRIERVDEPTVCGLHLADRWSDRREQFLAALARGRDGQLDARKDHLDAAAAGTKR